MEMREVFRKIAEGKELSPSEKDEFARFGGSMQGLLSTVSQWMKIGSPGSVQFNEVAMRSIRPLGSVLSPFVVDKDYHLTDTSIPDDGNWHYVTFNLNVYGNNPYFKWDETDPQKIFIQNIKKSFFIILTQAWEANATGARDARFEYYDQSDVKIGTGIMSIAPGFVSGGADNWFNGSRMVDFPDETYYIKPIVKQTSGGSLHLLYLSIDLHIL